MEVYFQVLQANKYKLLGAGVLGDSLGALGHGALGELPGPRFHPVIEGSRGGLGGWGEECFPDTGVEAADVKRPMAGESWVAPLPGGGLGRSLGRHGGGLGRSLGRHGGW